MIYLCNNMYTKYLKKCAIFLYDMKKNFFVLNLIQQYICYTVKNFFIRFLFEKLNKNKKVMKKRDKTLLLK